MILLFAWLWRDVSMSPPVPRCHDVTMSGWRGHGWQQTSAHPSQQQNTTSINIDWKYCSCVPLSLLNPPPPPRSVRWSVTWCPLCVPYHWGRARAIYWKLLECNKRNISGPSSLYSKIEINWLFASGVEHILGTTALRVEICKIRKQPSV